MIQQIIDDPFDEDRDYFVQTCKTRIDYFGKLTENNLKKLYYKSNTYEY